MFQLKSSLRRLTKKRNEQGFSLIELMVVVLIIGILVGIAVVAFGGAQNTSRNSRAASNLRNVQSVAATIIARGTNNAATPAARTDLNAISAADINLDEPNLVSTTAVTTGQAYGTTTPTSGLFCATGEANRTYVLSLANAGSVRYWTTSGCPSALQATIPAGGTGF